MFIEPKPQSGNKSTTIGNIHDLHPNNHNNIIHSQRKHLGSHLMWNTEDQQTMINNDQVALIIIMTRDNNSHIIPLAANSPDLITNTNGESKIMRPCKVSIAKG